MRALQVRACPACDSSCLNETIARMILRVASKPNLRLWGCSGCVGIRRATGSFAVPVRNPACVDFATQLRVSLDLCIAASSLPRAALYRRTVYIVNQYKQRCGPQSALYRYSGTFTTENKYGSLNESLNEIDMAAVVIDFLQTARRATSQYGGVD